jgi:hypothetical protein
LHSLTHPRQGESRKRKASAAESGTEYGSRGGNRKSESFGRERKKEKEKETKTETGRDRPVVVEKMEPEGRAEDPMEDLSPPDLRVRLPRLLRNRLQLFFWWFVFASVRCMRDCIETFQRYRRWPLPTRSGLAGNMRGGAFLIVPRGLIDLRDKFIVACALGPASDLWIWNDDEQEQSAVCGSVKQILSDFLYSHLPRFPPLHATNVSTNSLRDAPGT